MCLGVGQAKPQGRSSNSAAEAATLPSNPLTTRAQYPHPNQAKSRTVIDWISPWPISRPERARKRISFSNKACGTTLKPETARPSAITGRISTSFGLRKKSASQRADNNPTKVPHTPSSTDSVCIWRILRSERLGDRTIAPSIPHSLTMAASPRKSVVIPRSPKSPGDRSLAMMTSTAHETACKLNLVAAVYAIPDTRLRSSLRRPLSPAVETSSARGFDSTHHSGYHADCGHLSLPSLGRGGTRLGEPGVAAGQKRERCHRGNRAGHGDQNVSSCIRNGPCWRL